MSKYLASIVLPLILALNLAGCAETAGDKTLKQYSWRVEITPSDKLCVDFNDAALKGNVPIQKTILTELQRRRYVSRLLDINSLTASPPIGSFEAEVLCLWQTPNATSKRVAGDGVTEIIYAYESVQRKDETSFALYDETLVLRNGRLFSVERFKL